MAGPGEVREGAHPEGIQRLRELREALRGAQISPAEADRRLDAIEKEFGWTHLSGSAQERLDQQLKRFDRTAFDAPKRAGPVSLDVPAKSTRLRAAESLGWNATSGKSPREFVNGVKRPPAVATGTAEDPFLRELAMRPLTGPNDRAALVRRLLTLVKPAKLGEGVTAKAYEAVDPATNLPWVLKIARHLQPAWAFLPEEDPLRRQESMASNVRTIELLRQSPAFAKFAHVLPETFSPWPGITFQRKAEGRHYETLDDAAKKRADEATKEMAEAAGRAVPGMQVDAHGGNILYSERGEPVSWFDPQGGFGRDAWSAAKGLTEQRSAQSGFAAQGQLRHLGNGWVQDTAQALVVSNVGLNRAFAVQGPMRATYEATDRPEHPGRPFADVLGLPIEEERAAGPDKATQRFEHGVLTRQGDTVTVHLEPTVAKAAALFEPWLGDFAPTEGISALGSSWAQRVRDPKPLQGDALLVANLEKGAAFPVRAAFRYAYEVATRETGSLPTANALGAPVEEAHVSGGGALVQRFEHGTMVQSEKKRVTISLDAVDGRPARTVKMPIPTLGVAEGVARTLFFMAPTVFGEPTEEAHPDGNRWVQRFEHGNIYSDGYIQLDGEEPIVNGKRDAYLKHRDIVGRPLGPAFMKNGVWVQQCERALVGDNGQVILNGQNHWLVNGKLDAYWKNRDALGPPVGEAYWRDGFGWVQDFVNGQTDDNGNVRWKGQ